MNSFTLHLQSGRQYEKFDDVISFVGIDASGSFGIMAGHERMMTVLEFGLAQFRTKDGVWHYVAMPSGVVYFLDNNLSISTHRFVYGNDYDKVSSAISGILAEEEQQLHNFKSSINWIEQQMTRRLWKLQHEEI